MFASTTEAVKPTNCDSAVPKSEEPGDDSTSARPFTSSERKTLAALLPVGFVAPRPQWILVFVLVRTQEEAWLPFQRSCRAALFLGPGDGFRFPCSPPDPLRVFLLFIHTGVRNCENGSKTFWPSPYPRSWTIQSTSSAPGLPAARPPGRSRKLESRLRSTRCDR